MSWINEDGVRMRCAVPCDECDADEVRALRAEVANLREEAECDADEVRALRAEVANLREEAARTAKVIEAARAWVDAPHDDDAEVALILAVGELFLFPHVEK